MHFGDAVSVSALSVFSLCICGAFCPLSACLGLRCSFSRHVPICVLGQLPMHFTGMLQVAPGVFVRMCTAFASLCGPCGALLLPCVWGVWIRVFSSSFRCVFHSILMSLALSNSCFFFLANLRWSVSVCWPVLIFWLELLVSMLLCMPREGCR